MKTLICLPRAVSMCAPWMIKHLQHRPSHEDTNMPTMGSEHVCSMVLMTGLDWARIFSFVPALQPCFRQRSGGHLPCLYTAHREPTSMSTVSYSCCYGCCSQGDHLQLLPSPHPHPYPQHIPHSHHIPIHSPSSMLLCLRLPSTLSLSPSPRPPPSHLPFPPPPPPPPPLPPSPPPPPIAIPGLVTVPLLLAGAAECNGS